jgi:hypothetical protein
MRTLARIVLLSTLFALFGHGQDRAIHFSGQLSRGETFRKEISKDLVFALVPNTIDPEAISGWTITISPEGDHPRECNDFVWVVMPPYRSYNPRYLDTSYGTTAEEAMKFSPRDFNFVLNCSDYKQEEARVDRLLWSYNYTNEQVQEAQEKLGTSPQGSGRLWIRDYKISPAPKPAGDRNLGQIDSIRFEVEIELPKR